MSDSGIGSVVVSGSNDQKAAASPHGPTALCFECAAGFRGRGFGMQSSTLTGSGNFELTGASNDQSGAASPHGPFTLHAEAGTCKDCELAKQAPTRTGSGRGSAVRSDSEDQPSAASPHGPFTSGGDAEVSFIGGGGQQKHGSSYV